MTVLAPRRSRPGQPAPEFLPAAPRGTGLAALWLATAAACLVTSGLDASRAWAARAEAHERMQAAERRLARVPPRGTTSARRPLPSAPAPAAPGAQAAAAAQAALQHPWARVFDAVDAASGPRLQWLQLEHGDRITLRLEGRAPHMAAALEAAERLRRHGGWSDVVVGRMAPSAPEPDGTPGDVPFELTARLAGATP